jgi:hypothetical protein
MTEKSDLVVIATPVARKELPDRTVMPGVFRGNELIQAIQVETGNSHPGSPSREGR